MTSRAWSLPSSISLQSSVSPSLRRTSRLSLLILGIHGIVVAVEDIGFKTIVGIDRWFDQWCQSHLTHWVKQEILTPTAGSTFIAELTQFIGMASIESGIQGVGFAFEIGLLVVLWKFAWADPTSSSSPSYHLGTNSGLPEGALELYSIMAAVSFLTINAFFLLTTFSSSLFFRALDGFGARLAWSTPLSAVAGLSVGAFVVGHFAPALFQSSLKLTRDCINANRLPAIQAPLSPNAPAPTWRERLQFHYPSFQGRLVTLMVLPLSLLALANNLVWALALLGGS